MKIIKVRATFDFEVDVSDFDPKYVNVEALAIDLTKREIATLEPTDFDYNIIEKDK